MKFDFNLEKSLQNVDVVWQSPSKDSSGSMPIGNGQVVLNTWCEESSGDILVLIARTDSMSEISRVLKLGRLRLHFSDNPFVHSDSFRQYLHLYDGQVEFSAGATHLQLFVDSDSNTIHLSGNLGSAQKVTATLESWRRSEHVLTETEMRSAWSAQGAPFELKESADIFDGSIKDSVCWYHRNETSIVPTLLNLQSLTGLKGTFDPIIHRTFGGLMRGIGFVRQGDDSITSQHPISQLDLSIATHTEQTRTAGEFVQHLQSVLAASSSSRTEERTKKWWHSFWNRSWVFVDGDHSDFSVPANNYSLRIGKDSNGQNQFIGRLIVAQDLELCRNFEDFGTLFGRAGQLRSPETKGLTLVAKVFHEDDKPGRIFDKLTAGSDDGFLFDTYPGNSLRLIVGNTKLEATNCLQPRKEYLVAATYSAETGEAAIYVDNRRVAYRAPERGSMITQGYVLQRYVQACQGRGEYPIKFNGGFYSVEPTPMGIQSNPDFRNWGDAQWFQNVRHMYFPMLASGDFEQMEPFFHLYERVRTLAESRAQKYHNAEGAYFPETMTNFGTYAGKDYGWDRTGLEPNDVQSPWWRYAWNQGLELVSIMLDRWDYTQDDRFLKERALPMAVSVLQYFDTRFRKDQTGRIVIDPDQVVETYWEGVTNDMPCVSGLISVTKRLTKLPKGLLTPQQQIFFDKMRQACPELPIEEKDGRRVLAPAAHYVPKTSNVENGELYAVWPFRVASLGQPKYLQEAKDAYAIRKNHLDNGWGYDGNVAALLGMTEEAKRILNGKVRNSNSNYRWPATWGPNFDWLPDQNHGGNLLNTTNLMLLQAEPMELGGALRILPAWPKEWNVAFKLCAPGNTTVDVVYREGKLLRLTVTPSSRMKDIVLPDWISKN